MARKVVFEKSYIIDKSVDFIKENGIDKLSARELTKFIGCSTQPLFRIYDNMDIYKKDLKKELNKEYNEFLEKYIDKDNYLLSLSYAYVMYAKKENDLFKALFMSDLSDKKLIKNDKKVVEEIIRQYNVSEAKAESVYRDVSIYTHGLATQLCLKSLNISDKDLFYLINTCIKKNIKG